MAAEFLTPLTVRLLPETDQPVWQLVEPLQYRSDVAGVIIEAPAGFVTDFVSFSPLKNVGQRPAVIHDYLYSCFNVDRQLADAVLREALRAVGVDAVLAETMYEAVRLFGDGHRTTDYVFPIPFRRTV